MGSGTITTPGPSSGFAKKRQVATTAILDATGQLIAEKGIDGFTISEVAQRAQINRALIYHYFRNRDNLVAQAIGYILDRYESLQGPAVGVDAVERSTRVHIEHPEIARFFFQMLLTGRPLPGIGERMREAIEWVQSLQGEGSPDAGFDAGIAMAMLMVMQLSWAFSREEMARLVGVSVEEADERFIKQLRQMVGLGVRALGTPE
ncbi:MAG: TetR/AcrR family transcriptional regulator [Dehalococcoidia bacterium]